MAALEWSDALALDLPLMDDTHREFVDLLAQVEQADDATVVQRWQELVDHTEHHFGQEDAWMVATRFCLRQLPHHAAQGGAAGDARRHRAGRAGRPAAHPHHDGLLAQWFPQHAQMMDASLACTCAAWVLTPPPAWCMPPDALPAELIQGCGSTHSCVDTPKRARRGRLRLFGCC